MRQVLGRPAPTSVHMARRFNMKHHLDPHAPRMPLLLLSLHPSLDSPDMSPHCSSSLPDGFSSWPQCSRSISQPAAALHHCRLLPATTTKLDLSPSATVSPPSCHPPRLHLPHDFKNDASRTRLRSPPAPSPTSGSCTTNPSRYCPMPERLENLTWRMMSMRLQRLEPQRSIVRLPFRVFCPLLTADPDLTLRASPPTRLPAPSGLSGLSQQLRNASDQQQRRELLPTLRRL